MRAARAVLAGVLVAVAVLLALGGPARDVDARGGDDAARRTRDVAGGGAAVFARLGCGSCHRFAAGAGQGGPGPDLDAVLPSYDAAALRAKIVTPYPAGTPVGYLAMPQDFGRRMRAGELDALVAFLLAGERR